MSGYFRPDFRAMGMHLLAPLCLLAGGVTAEGLDIKFRDATPLDMFHIVNLGCPLFDTGLTFDLTTSASDVVIDTAYGGRGAQDPADVQIVAGAARLDPVSDGAQRLHLSIAELQNAAGIVVTFDSDDMLSADHYDRIAVSGSEIAGATVTLSTANHTATAVFDDQGNTVLIPPPGAAHCLSS